MREPEESIAGLERELKRTFHDMCRLLLPSATSFIEIREWVGSFVGSAYHDVPALDEFCPPELRTLPGDMWKHFRDACTGDPEIAGIALPAFLDFRRQLMITGVVDELLSDHSFWMARRELDENSAAMGSCSMWRRQECEPEALSAFLLGSKRHHHEVSEASRAQFAQVLNRLAGTLTSALAKLHEFELAYPAYAARRHEQSEGKFLFNELRMLARIATTDPVIGEAILRQALSGGRHKYLLRTCVRIAETGNQAPVAALAEVIPEADLVASAYALKDLLRRPAAATSPFLVRFSRIAFDDVVARIGQVLPSEMNWPIAVHQLMEAWQDATTNYMGRVRQRGVISGVARSHRSGGLWRDL